MTATKQAKPLTVTISQQALQNADRDFVRGRINWQTLNEIYRFWTGVSKV